MHFFFDCVCGVRVDSLWTLHRLCMDSVQIGGLHADLWSPRGVHKDRWGTVKYRKFAPQREGPFEIQGILGPVTYQLKLPHQWKIHPVFHAALLTPYKENNPHGPNFTKPPPDLIDQEEQYKMDGIINH
jgi:hypothetical protein